MSAPMLWLPEPPEGTRVCLGFDGSETGDWTCIKGETIDGLLFTPRWNGRPTLWNPADHGGRMPRHEVDAAVDYLFDRYDVERMYCDPPLWVSEVEAWSVRHGEKRVLKWETYRAVEMHDKGLERFHTDIATGRLTHDGCPTTTEHVRNARMAHRKDGRYVLATPDVSRKIDAAVASVVCHKAASDARAAGWDGSAPTIFFLP